MFNRHHMRRAYLLLAFCLIEVVLLYAVLCVLMGMRHIGGVGHFTHFG
jgi:hypothetical protein